MSGHIKNGVESDWFVIVATDRGLYAEWLYNQIQSVGWHPFMRINQQGQFQHHGQREWCLLTSLVPKLGDHWKGLVTCFKTNSIKCTLLGCWDQGYTDPWLIVTDLPPEVADACWYSMRSWIECMFKDGKRGGLAWHQTKMIHPKRAERHWLALSVCVAPP